MLRPGQAIGLCVLALLMLGVVMVNSAGMTVGGAAGGGSGGGVTIESILMSRSTVYMGLAVGVMLAVGLLPLRRLVGRLEAPAPAVAASEPVGRGFLRHLTGLWPLWAGVSLLVLILASVYVPGIGREVNASKRWINLQLPGLESVQPSEIAKWGLIGVIAWYGCRNARRMGTFWHGLVPGLAAAGLVSAVIVVEDLGTGALVGMVACIMLVAAGARVWHLVLLAPIPLAGVVAAIITNPYRLDRITSFLNPFADAQGKGYHMIQSMLAVVNGQFFGRGLGHGLQKFGYLPEDTTDFLFAIICEELGVFGAAMVIFLYGALLWSCLTVIRREPSRLLRLVALGVTATVGLQAIINLAVVTGLGPTKGIALPLLSSGGTGWILTAASLGVVIAMDRSQGVMQWYRVKDGSVMEQIEPAVAEPASDATPPGLPAADDSRFAAPLHAAAVAKTPIFSNPHDQSSGTGAAGAMLATEQGQGMLFGDVAGPAVEAASGDLIEAGAPIITPWTAPTTPLLPPPPPQVVVTDDARGWPDTARLRPA